MAYIDQFDQPEEKEMSFLDHLDALRAHLFRIAISILIGFIIALLNKEFIFDQLIFGPTKNDFITYRWLCELSEKYPSLGNLCFKMEEFKLVANEFESQFMKYMSGSLTAGIILAFPYIIFELWRFVKPALKMTEANSIRSITFAITGLFAIGITFGYLFIAPFSIGFFASFRLSDTISNYFSIDSYISLLTLLTLATGLVFQLPVLGYFLARVGLIGSNFLKTYRRHSIVVITVIAAMVTPDVTSLFLMMVPLWLLYEVTAIIVRRVEKKYHSEEA